MTPQDSKIFRPWDKSEPSDPVSLYNAWTSLILDPRRSLETSTTSVTSSTTGTTVTTTTTSSSTTSSSSASSIESNGTTNNLLSNSKTLSSFTPGSPVVDPILSAFPSVASATSFNAAVAAVTAAAASGHHSVGSLASFMSSSNHHHHHHHVTTKKQRPKRFHCPHCQIAFSNQGQLRGHVRIHTGERPFVCDHENCGKSFTRNEELTRHKRYVYN